MDQNLAWLTQKTEDPKSNKENLTFSTHTKYDWTENNKKVVTPPPDFYINPVTGLSPLSSKNFSSPTQVIQFSEGGGGGVPTMQVIVGVIVLVEVIVLNIRLSFFVDD